VKELLNQSILSKVIIKIKWDVFETQCSNLGPILPRFRDIAGLLLRTTPPLFYPNFKGVPFGLDWDVVAPRSEDPQLIIPYSCN